MSKKRTNVTFFINNYSLLKKCTVVNGRFTSKMQNREGEGEGEEK